MDDKKITIADIARDLGVSKTTVSRAISGKGRIGNETKEIIAKYIEEHHYKPNVIAKGLATSRTYNVGLVLPGDYNLMDLPFFQKCMGGVCEYASTMDYDVLVSMVNTNDISQLKRMINNHKVDGVILTRTLIQDAPAAYLKEKGIPFVAIGTSSDEEIVQVDNDHEAACRELTSILLASKIGKLGLIGGDRSYMVTRKRMEGFLHAFSDSELVVDDEQLCLDCENALAVERATDKLLRQKTDCILCMDDSICLTVLTYLRRLGKKVPEDVKIASFYNSSVLENQEAAITSLQFDAKEIGEESCRVLLRMIEGEKNPKPTLLGYEVSLKESTKNTR